jgi:hypothetical protein
MTRLSSLPLINQIAGTRDVLVEKLRRVNAGEFVVTIGGSEREDDEVKRQVKPQLQRVLRERIASVENDLGCYGFDVDII